LTTDLFLRIVKKLKRSQELIAKTQGDKKWSRTVEAALILAGRHDAA